MRGRGLRLLLAGSCIGLLALVSPAPWSDERGGLFVETAWLATQPLPLMKQSGRQTTMAAAAGETASASPASKFYLDLRSKTPSTLENFVLDEQSSGSIMKVLMSLFEGVKTKLAKLGKEPPSGQGVDGLLVDADAVTRLAEEAAGAGLPLLVVETEESDATTVTGDAIIGRVLNPTSGEVIGGMTVPASTPWQKGPMRYLRVIWELADGDGNADREQSEASPIAKTLPLDAGLWAAALMKRR
eukprot:TRINITY_DN65909_c0_g1_i1.p1 TRINITY_DN65909_c0_g1~~TRINITY_DN65909_c0_g1_i1.p1  ORF type:complete len:243 (-),score=48.83 TRINITY_DN65909_c0_g1_i1:82-810(-)